MEYTLSEVMEPNLFVIRKQKRDGPEKVTPMLTYYILDGSIYQAPQLCNVFAGRLVSILFLSHLGTWFILMCNTFTPFVSRILVNHYYNVCLIKVYLRYAHYMYVKYINL